MVSDPCSLASDDKLSCAFGGVVVPAELKDATSAACVVPSLNASGTVEFEFKSVSKKKGNYAITKAMKHVSPFTVLRSKSEHLQPYIVSTPKMSYIVINACYKRYNVNNFLYVFVVACEVVNVSPTRGHMAGGSTITVTISNPCTLQPTDNLQCTFDGIQVPASYQSANTATCVMPLVDSTGTIPFMFIADTGGNRDVTASMDFESSK